MSAVHEGCHHAGVDAAGEAQDHAVPAHLRTDLGDLLVDDALHGPAGLETADAEEEVLEHAAAIGGMVHLGMELRGIEPARRALHRSHRARLGMRRDGEALRNTAHGVAVAHPHGLLARRRGQKLARALADELGGAVLALVGMGDLAAEDDGHDLVAVAEAEHGQAEVEDGGVDLRRVLGIHARRPAREDDRRR